MSKSSIAKPGIKSAALVGFAFGAAAFAFVGATSTVLVAMLIGGLIGITFGNVKLSALALLLPTVPIQACVAETTTRYTSAPLCEPGRAEICACPDGGESAQVCDDDGAGWGECECGDGSVDGGGSGGTAGAAGTTGDGGPIQCTSTCEGSCSGRCSGKCIGYCQGTCLNPRQDGSCAGECIGTCMNSQCLDGNCEGMCNGICG